MKMTRNVLLFVIILLSGCTSGKTVLKVDPSLADNATVYEVKAPDTHSDNRLNVSFGPYSVTEADISSTTTTLPTCEPADGTPVWVSQGPFKKGDYFLAKKNTGSNSRYSW